MSWKAFQRGIWALLALCVGGVVLLLSMDSVTVRFDTSAGWDSREVTYPD